MDRVLVLAMGRHFVSIFLIMCVGISFAVLMNGMISARFGSRSYAWCQSSREGSCIIVKHIAKFEFSGSGVLEFSSWWV